MSYLASHRGDYLGSYRGDPGFFKKLFKFGSRVAIGYATGGPIGAIAGGATSLIGADRPPRPKAIPTRTTRQAGIFPIGIGGPRGINIGTASIVPGFPGQMPRGVTGAFGAPRRRRMNVGNAKALRRAIRRQQGFVKLARKALKGTGYSIVTRGSRSRRPISINESGPGSVIVR